MFAKVTKFWKRVAGLLGSVGSVCKGLETSETSGIAGIFTFKVLTGRMLGMLNAGGFALGGGVACGARAACGVGEGVGAGGIGEGAGSLTTFLSPRSPRASARSSVCEFAKDAVSQKNCTAKKNVRKIICFAPSLYAIVL